MYARVKLWNVVGRNRLGAVVFRMDIAAPGRLDAFYVARQMAKQQGLELSDQKYLVFSGRPRKSNGQEVLVGMGYMEIEKTKQAREVGL